MSEDKTNIRWERITKMLKELEYEVVRGMMDGDIAVVAICVVVMRPR